MYFNNKRFTWVDIEATNHCNFNCWFCPRQAMTRPKGMMDYEQYKTMVLNLGSANFLKEILIGGIGEPTLHPDLFKMLSFIKENTALRAVVITNGSRLNDRDFAKGLLMANPDRVIISYRISQPSQRERSGLPLSLNYEEYVKGILKFIELKYSGNYNTEIRIAFFKETYYSKYILDIKTRDFINEEKINVFIKQISRIIKNNLPLYNYYTNGIFSHLSNVDNIPVYPGLVFRFDSPSCWTTVVEKDKLGGKYYPARYGSCLGLLENFAILWNGDVTPCCGDFDGKIRLGNIFEQKDILKILSSKRSVELAKQLRKKRMPVRTCQVCRGGKNRKEKWANLIGSLLYTG